MCLKLKGAVFVFAFFIRVSILYHRQFLIEQSPPS